jgi:hypothetical protein
MGSRTSGHSEQDYLRLAQRARRMADEAVTDAVRASLLKMADRYVEQARECKILDELKRFRGPERA